MTNREPEYRRRLREKAEEDKREAQRERDEAAKNAHVNKIVSAMERVAEKLDRQSDENTPAKKSERNWQRAEVIGLWVAAAVGIAAICVSSDDSHKQRAVMEGQLNVLITDQRPWVSLDLKLDEPLRIEGPATPIIVSYALNNVGKSPAFDLDFMATMIPWGVIQPDAPPSQGFATGYPTKEIESAIKEVCGLQETMRQGQVMYPNVPDAGRWRAGVIPKQKGFIAGYIVIGCATYKIWNDSMTHRTIRIFNIGMREYGKMIDLNEAVSASEIYFRPYSQHGSRAN